jgi:hypothetical protein
MIGTFRQLTSTTPGRHWTEVVVEVLLAMIIVVTPLMFGAAAPWSQQITLILATLIVVATGLNLLLRPRGGRRWGGWVWLPIAGFVALVLFQLAPLPGGLIAMLSPATEGVRQTFLRDLPDVPPAQRLTMYLHGTLGDLRLLLGVIAVFAAVVLTFRHPGQVKGLLLAMVGSAAVVVAVQLYQVLTRTGSVFDVPLFTLLGEPVSNSFHPFSGPFMNHSHFGQFVNLGIGAAGALLLIQLDEVLLGKKLRARFGDLLRHQDLWVARFAALFILLAVPAIGFSQTRGGMISTLVAGLVVFGLMWWADRRRQESRAAVPALLGLAVVVVGLAIGFEAAFERMGTLSDFDRAQGGRIDILRDVAAVWSQFPIFGTGLGTFGIVFVPFDSHTGTSATTHAENEYAHLLMETGLLGIACILGFLVLVFLSAGRCVRQVRDFRDAPSVRHGVFGLIFGLVAILIHSASDFGQHLPGVALMTACTTGLLVVLPGIGGRRERAQESQPWRWPAVVGCGLLAAGLVVGVWQLDRERRADALYLATIEQAAGDYVSEDEILRDEAYAALLATMQQGIKLVPHDVERRHELVLARWVAVVADAGDGDVTRAVDLNETQLEFARRIADEALSLRPMAPTYGPPLSLAARLEHFVLQDPAGLNRLRLAYELDSSDAQVALMLGEQELESGDIDSGVASVRRAVAINDGTLAAAYRALLRADQWPAARELAGSDGTRLLLLADVGGRHLRDHDHPDLAQQVERVRQEAVVRLRRDARQGLASFAELRRLATIAEQDEQWADAERYLRATLDDQWRNRDLRTRLVRAVRAQGRLADAVEEARILQSQHPQNDEVRQLYNRLIDERRRQPEGA